MERYSSYKDSGIEWIGEIPDHWELVRLKNVVQTHAEKSQTGSLTYIGLENIESWTGRYVSCADGVVDESTGLNVEAGWVLFGKLRPYLAKAHLADAEGQCSGEFLVLEPTAVEPKFLFYSLLQARFIDYVNSATYGAKMPRANWDIIGSAAYCCPTLPEQVTIANFLDKKTCEIDSLITDTKKSIELLVEYKKSAISEAVTRGLVPEAKTKDSEVEWIGEIPEQWEVRRISELYRQRNTKVSDKDFPALSVTMQGIVPQLDTAAKTNDGDNRKLVIKGDFVINSRSDRRGSCGVSSYDGSVSLISNVLSPMDSSLLDTAYFGFLFKTEYFAHEYFRWGSGIVDDLWSTNWSRMKNIKIPVPPIHEQRAIAEHVQFVRDDIGALVADKLMFIERLVEYRKALISEAVTGKFKVSGADSA